MSIRTIVTTSRISRKTSASRVTGKGIYLMKTYRAVYLHAHDAKGEATDDI